MGTKFVHLHVHTEYSLLDGLSNIKKLFAATKQMGMDALAITDHGVMYGAVDFYKQGIKEGVKPIIGMEAYTTNVDLKEHPEKGSFKNNHLLLLAKNYEGYKNLMKLTSIAHLEGFYYRPRVDRETLKKYSKGLICTSACPKGELPEAILEDDIKRAKSTLEWYLDVFGSDYYLEVQRHNFEADSLLAKEPQIKDDLTKFEANSKKINKTLVELSRQFGIPLVATNDVHYIEKQDAPAQDALVCVATGKNVLDIKRLRYIDSPSFYLTSPEEMQALFPDIPDAVSNTLKIAKKCDLTIETLGKWFFPNFDLPKGLDSNGYLKQLSHQKLSEKIENPSKEVKERLDLELGIITQKGYSPYFLIVMDLVNWANDNGIITNTRGSAAGSLVSYVLGITTVNPITYYLPFERFLNPYRPSPPDIDLDVADDRREEILEYMVTKYGKSKVAQICTFGRMLSRGAVRDVARVLGYPYATGDRISKLIPPPKQGFPITIPKALGTIEELKSLYESDSDAKTVLDLAIQVEGSARHISVHAAGVVISPTEITDFTPLQKEPSGEKIITQYEFHACEDIGLIKFDILGIRHLSILGAAIDIVEKSTGKRIVIRDIPLDDKKTFKMLGIGETMGVFQLGSAGMTKHLMDLKPSRIEDIMAMVALYRPGPMAVIPEYIKRKQNPKLVKYLDSRMEKFLGASYGLLVYQDDLLFCALDLAGYTWEEADKFRKAVGKKIPEEMAAQKDKFVKGIIEHGQQKEFAETLWKLFEPFQAYGFNKAHAASYGIIAYQTAYMKANYPVEYMTALLTAEAKDTDKVTLAINECRRMKIKVLPPDINESQEGFTIIADKDSLDGKAIRFGLDAIKNVGNAAMDAIFEARETANFVSFADFIGRVDGRRVNKKVLESLIKVGAMSAFGGRASLMAVIDEIKNKAPRPKVTRGQQDLFSEDTEKKTAAPIMIISSIPEFDEDELQNYERQLLGFSLSAKPVTEIIAQYEHLATHKIHEVSEEANLNSQVKLACVVSEVRVVITKKSGAEMAFVKASDDTGTIDLVIFPKLYTNTRSVWIENTPMLISGKVDLRGEGASILVDSVETKDTIATVTGTETVYIKVPLSADMTDLANLKELLQASPGEQKACLVFEGKDKQIDLPFGISWSERLARLISEVLME